MASGGSAPNLKCHRALPSMSSKLSFPTHLPSLALHWLAPVAIPLLANLANWKTHPYLDHLDDQQSGMEMQGRNQGPWSSGAQNGHEGGFALCASADVRTCRACLWCDLRPHASLPWLHLCSFPVPAIAHSCVTTHEEWHMSSTASKVSTATKSGKWRFLVWNET